MRLLLLIVGCSWFEPDLAVSAVQPGELRVGTEVQVLGQGFSPEVLVELRGGEAPLPLDGMVVKGDLLIEGRIPDIEPGTYDLVVSRRGDSVGTSVRIRAEVEEIPCARGYEVNTKLSLPDGLAIVDRFYEDGKRERVETPLGEIERLEYLVSQMEDGRRCTAIVLRKTDGAALLFEDDEGDLRERAETLARFMEKELAVVE